MILFFKAIFPLQLQKTVFTYVCSTRNRTQNPGEQQSKQYPKGNPIVKNPKQELITDMDLPTEDPEEDHNTGNLKKDRVMEDTQEDLIT